MDSRERRRLFLEQLSPWIGFIVAAGALALGGRALFAGYYGGGAVGYVAGAVELAAGYVAARRAWDQRIDAWFLAAVALVVVVSVFVLLTLDLPPSIFAGG